MRAAQNSKKRPRRTICPMGAAFMLACRGMFARRFGRILLLRWAGAAIFGKWERASDRNRPPLAPAHRKGAPLRDLSQGSGTLGRCARRQALCLSGSPQPTRQGEAERACRLHFTGNKPFWLAGHFFSGISSDHMGPLHVGAPGRGVSLVLFILPDLQRTHTGRTDHPFGNGFHRYSPFPSLSSTTA